MVEATYCFGPFVIDGASGVLLTTDGTEIPLRAKSFALLHLFAENAGQLLSRDRIMQTIWRGIVVTDDSLTQCVGEIRRALRDDDARLLRTIKGRGYVFAAEVRRTASTARQKGGTVVPPPVFSRPVVWQESRAGRVLRGLAVGKVLMLGRHDASPRFRLSKKD